LAAVGSGDQRWYHGLADALGVAERVHFLGATTDLPPIYQTADAFVLPSVYETFSLVTFEAAASGLPILATPTGGVSDLVRDGVNGWFIERDANMISGYLNRLSTAPRMATRMGQAAREAAAGFPWTHMVDAYMSLYAELSIGTEDQAES
jgi:UDP-glucose:(heptosyl)LPS alpha-1,3-glucosyltransferase